MSQILRADLPKSDKGNDPNDHRDDPTYLNDIRFIVPPMTPPPRDSLVITDDELQRAELTPKCIVDHHLYADVAQKIAPGGTGKTTLTLWEAVHVVLGLDLYGSRVVTPGWVLIVTAEDRRDRLVARLRRIMDAMGLTPDQRRKVQGGIIIWDVTGEQAKLIHEIDGNLALTPLADRIIQAYRDDPPVLVEFDPLVSFGAAENRVNDNEQALVLAARRIVNGLGCCVRYIHHTGKLNAREKNLDQYSGRGGSALPDGSRITAVLQSWSPRDAAGRTPPATLRLAPESQVTLYARAKLSYCAPNLPLIWIKRDGFAFEWFEERRISHEEAKATRADQLLRFLASEIKLGRFHTKTGLRTMNSAFSMTVKHITEAIEDSLVSGQLVTYPLPEDQRHGGRKDYLSPRDLEPVVSSGCKRVAKKRAQR